MFRIKQVYVVTVSYGLDKISVCEHMFGVLYYGKIENLSILFAYQILRYSVSANKSEIPNSLRQLHFGTRFISPHTNCAPTLSA